MHKPQPAIAQSSATHRLTPATFALQAEILEEKLKFITEKIPTRIMNTAGSNAGAGSGEFHMYRMVRCCSKLMLPSALVR